MTSCRGDTSRFEPDRPLFPSVQESRTEWVCAADHQAYDLIHGLKKAGLKVPRDVSVTGFDGIVMGPDGAAYVADWYSPIIQHGEVDFRDQRRDQVHGRIWRITAKGRPLVPAFDYKNASIEDLLDLLKHEADWVRMNARQELKERKEDLVAIKIAEWVANLDRNHPDYEHHLLEALWAYQTSTTQRGRFLLDEVLQSPDYRARAAAVRVLYHWQNASEVQNAPALLARAASDPHPQVGREAVTALGQSGSAEAIPIALEVLNHPLDPNLDFALWRTCRLLEPYWLPAFQRGELCACLERSKRATACLSSP